ncbi:hypothetical protein BKA62DRAFT_257331 [Auriculariales sp. MPI-PUGE-AT-0066]|nr:hypothetical protein BKA62DRAFT_257331 [Auriculariales sp. MPI-PUGE-AT-0066]
MRTARTLGTRNPPFIFLPEDVLLLIFEVVRLGCVAQQDRWTRGIPLADLLSCSLVCRAWANVIPFAMYRDIRVPMARTGSNVRAAAFLKRTLMDFDASIVGRRVLAIVRSLQLAVHLYSHDEGFVSPVGVLQNGLSSDGNATAANRDLHFCSPTELAQLLSHLKRLNSLAIIQFKRRPEVTPLPKMLLTALRGLDALTHLCLGGEPTGSLPPWHEFVRCCPTLTHLRLCGAFDLRPPFPPLSSEPNQPTCRLQMLSIQSHNFDTQLEQFAPLCQELNALFVEIDRRTRLPHEAVSLTGPLPQTLKVLSINCSAQYPVGFSTIVHRLPHLQTLIFNAVTPSLPRLILMMPTSVTCLGFDIDVELATSVDLTALLEALHSRAHQIETLVIFVPYFELKVVRGSFSSELEKQWRLLFEDFQASHKHIRIRTVTRSRGLWHEHVVM